MQLGVKEQRAYGEPPGGDPIVAATALLALGSEGTQGSLETRTAAELTPDFVISPDFLPPPRVAGEHRKDPCIVVKEGDDGRQEFHIFCSYGKKNAVGENGQGGHETWEIMHYMSHDPRSGWAEVGVCGLDLTGPHIAAPAVVWDEVAGKWFMIIQTDFLGPSPVYELTSEDGLHFTNAQLVIDCDGNDGPYDPHYSYDPVNPNVRGEITYSWGRIYHGEQYGLEHRHAGVVELRAAAKDENGWQEKGTILSQQAVTHHNQPPSESEIATNPQAFAQYEWGLEGSQKFYTGKHECLIFVSFDPDAPFGTKQQLMIAVRNPESSAEEYLITELDLYAATKGIFGHTRDKEFGHASVLIKDGQVLIYHQYRTITIGEEGQPSWSPWDGAVAVCELDELNRYLDAFLKESNAEVAEEATQTMPVLYGQFTPVLA